MLELYDVRIDGSYTVRGAPRWDARRYEAAVAGVLQRLHSSRVGRIVLDELGGSDVLILPNDDRTRLPGASSQAIAADAGPASGHFPRAAEGSFIQLVYTPSDWLPPGSPARPGMAVFAADDVLLHELIHSVEQATGTIRQVRFSRTAFDIAREAERRAVRVTNMYRAEQRRPLRASYGDVAPLHSSGRIFEEHGIQGLEAGRSPYGYRRGHWVRRTDGDPRQDAIIRDEVEMALRFMVDQPFLTAALEALPRYVCWYNPFRDARLARPPYLLVPGAWRPPVELDMPTGPRNLA